MSAEVGSRFTGQPFIVTLLVIIVLGFGAGLLAGSITMLSGYVVLVRFTSRRESDDD